MIQLFVGGKRVDLFKDENIEIQDSIQDAKDIGKIFTTFSRTFTVPANKNNNNVFQNFYNFDVVNGFDPRQKVRSVITKNGATYRNGFIQIRKVKLKNNKPTSYTIFFTGLLSTLKDKLQDDRLSDLQQLDNYNHVYSKENVEKGFRSLLIVNSDKSVDPEIPTNSDISYPFISVQDRYAVNANGKVKRVSNNGTIPTGSGGKLDYQDIKPAIRCLRIVEAIEAQYDITFSDDFFRSSPQFSNLSLWLNRNKGRLGTESTYNVELFNTDFGPQVSGNDVVDGDDNIIVYNNVVQSNTPQFDLQRYNYNYQIDAQGEGQVFFKIFDANNNDEELTSLSFEFDSDTTQFNFGFTFQIPISENGNRVYRPYLQLTTQESGISNIDVRVQIIQEVREGTGPVFTEGNYAELNIKAVNDVIIKDQIPKLKVIDFLTSIFKMYNLTAELVDDVIKVQTLDSFYDSGKEVDITRFVDITNSSISKVDTIKQFNFKHEEANSLLLVKGNELDDFEYGNLEKELEETPDLVLGGKTLDIQTNFYKIFYERLRDVNGVLSNILFGWYVDDNQEQLSNEPIVFYPEKNLTKGAIQFKNKFFTNDPQTYIAPNNATSLKTTNFSAELSEFDSLTEESLFELFYSKYVSRVFSPQSRKVELEAVLRDDFILSYKLNDILIYKNRRHLINDISINLNTNKAKLTLLNIPIEVINFTANDENSESLGLSTSDINVSGDAGLETFDVVSDSDWDITVDDTWLSVNPTKGTRNATVDLTTQENNTGNVRTAKVAVSTNNLTQEITVTQAIK